MATFPPGVEAKAADMWSSAILTYGKEVTFGPTMVLRNSAPIKAFCKRPKILGLFDRTEQSYDQTRFMVMVRSQDVPDVGKFDRVRWDEEDHAVISVTEVSLGTNIFGYRVLVKG